MTSTAPVSISELKNAPAKAALPQTSIGLYDLQGFELMQRVAKMMSASSLMPKQYQGPDGLPNCVVALNMAYRMQADPLMVCQNLYVVHGRPAWSAQFLIACFNKCGRYSALRYEWQSERGKDDWGCRAWAVEIASGERVSGPLVTIATAKAEGWINREGSKWKTIPELMLTYRAAAWMIRTNAPEIAMGLPTTEEADDIVTLTREDYSVAQVKAGEHTGAQSGPQVVPVAEKSEPIAAVETKTDEPAKPAKEAKKSDLDPPSYSYVANIIASANTLDDLDVATDLISSVADPQQKAELDVEARARRTALGAK